MKNFLVKGATLDLITDESLAAKGDDMAAPTIANLLDEADRANGPNHHTGDKIKDGWVGGGPPPDVEGESSLPIAWSVSQSQSRSKQIFSADRTDGRPSARRHAPSPDT